MDYYNTTDTYNITMDTNNITTKILWKYYSHLWVYRPAVPTQHYMTLQSLPWLWVSWESHKVCWCTLGSLYKPALPICICHYWRVQIIHQVCVHLRTRSNWFSSWAALCHLQPSSWSGLEKARFLDPLRSGVGFCSWVFNDLPSATALVRSTIFPPPFKWFCFVAYVTSCPQPHVQGIWPAM